MASDKIVTLRILLVGPSNGGKTSLLLRYLDDIFDTETATATIGVEFRSKKVSIRGKQYKVLLFDTAGQERFQPLTSSYYRSAQGVIIVYDTSNRDSFLSMEHWFREAETYASTRVVKCLVGSKTDKAASRAVKYEEGKELAERYDAMFVEVSSKTRENVRRPFVDVIDKIVETPELVNWQVRRGATGDNAVDVGGQPGAGERITVCAC
ncbi:ras family-domain-containing protein [Tirmania nivea]|nr:ras family-domain-containing protein [Tirmania nivea]